MKYRILSLIMSVAVLAGCSGKNALIKTDVPERPAGQESMLGFAAAPLDTVRIGIVGLGMRGSDAMERLTYVPGTKITAICDIEEDRTEASAKKLVELGKPEPKCYSGESRSWEGLCKQEDVDLVYICTDWINHVPVALCAMENGKHVAVEVPAALNLEDIWALVNTSERTRRHCMMLENCIYDFFELSALAMVQDGLFGEIVHAEGAYNHNLDPFWGEYWQSWRMNYNKTHRGDLYPTHGIGPVCQALNIHRGDRMTTLVSMDTDPFNGPAVAQRLDGAAPEDFKNGDHTGTFIRTANGKTILIEHNVMNPRPYSRMYQLVGTEGFASKYPISQFALRQSINPQEKGFKREKVYSGDAAEELMEKYPSPILTPELTALAKEVGGHGGMDYIMDYRLIYCLRNGLPLDMDVYDMAEWSAVKELSRISIENGNAPVEFPDFTRGAWDKVKGYSYAFAGAAPLAGDRIRTKWAAEVDPANVLPEYPRPQMVRNTVWKNLNGRWDYAIVPKKSAGEAFPKKSDGKILVPFCVESALSGVGRKVTGDDALWYRRTFTAPVGEKVLLHFGAVDWKSTVYVNGNKVGVHTGGYTAFSYDVTSYLVPGPNVLEVCVEDGTNNGEQPRGKQVLKPGGIWYTAVTGIWQSVWLESVPKMNIVSCYAVPDVENGTVKVTVDAPELLSNGGSVKVEVCEGGIGYAAGEQPCGAAVAAGRIDASGAEAVITIANPRLWTPEQPYLYALELTACDAEGRQVDKVSCYTAMRSVTQVIDADGYKRLGLNGAPYFQFGPLDQGWWPDGLYTAPTDEALRYDIEKTKEFGFNMIRKHVKVEPARWYWWCDRLGVLVWQDMPNMTDNLNQGNSPQWGQWGFDTGFDYPLTESAKTTYLKEWPEVIAQQKVFPCIVVWVPFNEAWSQFDTEKVVDLTKELDPTRLVNPASGGNYRHCGDIMDIHNYPGPLMKFTSEGERIDVLGEYGGLGLPLEGHLWQPDRNWGYIGYKTAEEVIAKYEEFAAQLASIVSQGVSAAVYTQTTDCEIEVNGLMTYDRIPKLDNDRLYKANRTVIEALPRQ